MGEFFKGWRRKAGLVTLVVALLLMMGWMRSYFLSNSIGMPRGGGYCSIHSSVGQLAWMEIHPVRTGVFKFTDTSLSQTFLDDAVAVPARLRGGTIEWQWQWFGFDVSTRMNKVFVHSATENVHTAIGIVPYWLLVLPLTLLSTWLILIKPRKAKGSP